jgi:membrane protease YdiL (CAAX protease family)
MPLRALLVLGCALLAARPLAVDRVPSPTALLLALFGALLAVGLLAPVAPAGRRARPLALVGVVALGVSAFAVGRAWGGGAAPHPPTARFLALNLLAAVAEEAFFRRAVFGALLRSGPTAAIGGSAALFAVVHVSVYGWWVLPIDLAAGLLLSWQRHASGSWIAPAVTHAIANVLVLV